MIGEENDLDVRKQKLLEWQQLNLKFALNFDWKLFL